MENFILKEVLKKIEQSPDALTKKNIENVKKLFPIPAEYEVLWFDVEFGTRISGLVVTDQALIIKADQKTLRRYNKTTEDKKDKQTAIYHLIKWEYFDPDHFEVCVEGGYTTLSYNQSITLISQGDSVAKFFENYKLLIKKYTQELEKIPTDFEFVMATDLNVKKSGKVQIQTLYRNSGAECVQDCFDEKTGRFKYLNADGSPMQLEVPSDKYFEAINVFKDKIRKYRVPATYNEKDAYKYIRRGKVTYRQALELCRGGNIKSLIEKNGKISCSFPLGLSFLVTYNMRYIESGDKKDALNAALAAGMQIFGTSFMGHVLDSQMELPELRKQFIPVSTYLVQSLGYKTTQNIVNAIRSASGREIMSGVVATRQLTKVLQSNVVTSVLTFVIFSIPDTFDMFSQKISGAQYTKNMLSLLGTMATAGGGTLVASIGAAKIGAATGTVITPGIGTVIGIGGGLVGGVIGGTAVKVLGDKTREDDSVILSRMFNGIVLNLIYDYMLQEPEIDMLIDRLNTIKPKAFKKLFKELIAEKEQEKKIVGFIWQFFEEIIQNRPVIEEPKVSDMVEILKQFDPSIVGDGIVFADV